MNTSMYSPPRRWPRRSRRALRAIAMTATLSVTACALDGGPDDPANDDELVISEAEQPLVVNRSVQVGVRCQQEYQNNWQVDVGNNDVWNQCGWFANKIGTHERLGYYYNLHGASPAFHEPDTCGWPCGYVDAVDLFYMVTHGGADQYQAFWSMWDQLRWATTAFMRLGDSGRRNMIFATYSCDTHAPDGFTWTRWINAFRGGLVTTVGGGGLLYAGTPQTGTDFAQRLINGQSVKNAWLESTWYANDWNTPAQINTGVNANDCYARSNVHLDNLFGTPILRDNAIGFMCWVWWN